MNAVYDPWNQIRSELLQLIENPEVVFYFIDLFPDVVIQPVPDPVHLQRYEGQSRVYFQVQLFKGGLATEYRPLQQEHIPAHPNGL